MRQHRYAAFSSHVGTAAATRARSLKQLNLSEGGLDGKKGNISRQNSLLLPQQKASMSRQDSIQLARHSTSSEGKLE